MSDIITSMSKYYILDTTLGKTPVYFDTVPELVKHAEGTVKRYYRQTRQQYMQNLTDLGHGYDDADGKNFIAALSEVFNIGVANTARHLKCNIHDVNIYSGYRTEMGD